MHVDLVTKAKVKRKDKHLFCSYSHSKAFIFFYIYIEAPYTCRQNILQQTPFLPEQT